MVIILVGLSLSTTFNIQHALRDAGHDVIIKSAESYESRLDNHLFLKYDKMVVHDHEQHDRGVLSNLPLLWIPPHHPTIIKVVEYPPWVKP